MPEVTGLFYHRHITYSAMPCQWSSRSSGDPASIKASLGAGSLTLMLAGLHADLRNIAPARLFV